jgi:hypothetical protein
MATAEERQHNERLIHEYRRRLRPLELRAARQGDDTDPAVLNEIEQLKLNIATLEELNKPPPPKEVQEAIWKQAGDWAMLFAQSVQMNTRLTRVEERVETIVATQTAAQLERLATREDIQTIKEQQAETERKRKRWQPVYLLLWGAAALAIILAVVFGRIYL